LTKWEPVSFSRRTVLHGVSRLFLHLEVSRIPRLTHRHSLTSQTTRILSKTAGTIENLRQYCLSVRQVLLVAFLLGLTARQGFDSAGRDHATLTYRDDRYTSWNFMRKHISHVSSFLHHHALSIPRGERDHGSQLIHTHTHKHTNNPPSTYETVRRTMLLRHGSRLSMWQGLIGCVRE
jgi:hypothetical protein